jgi:uncharacterized protein (TIGR03083 family)
MAHGQDGDMPPRPRSASSRSRGADDRGADDRGAGSRTSRTRSRDAAAGLSDLARAVLEQWRRISAAVDALPEAGFEQPSVLPGWTVGDLVMHVARSATAVTEALRPVPSDLAGAEPGPGAGGRPISAVDYLTGTGARAEEIAATTRALSETARMASDPSAWLAAEVAAARAGLDVLTSQGGSGVGSAVVGSGVGDPQVATPGGPMVMTEFLRTRAVEAVVHGLDLGVEPSRPALRVAVRLFAELFAVRVPGHAVELRVPPFAAVQIVEGPRHTRGTPPNVVETGGVPFVLLCAGRLTWNDAVADGRVSASGERADLRPWLPLL